MEEHESLVEGFATYGLVPGGYDTPGEADTFSLFRKGELALPVSGNEFTAFIADGPNDIVWFVWDGVPIGAWGAWV